jgi:regulator of protease activity HflC (stomatin/prohibitin superfamily)
MNKVMAMFVLVGAMVLSGCSPVTVPPAHVGKLLTPSGYQPEILPSGKYWEGMREELVLIETKTDTYTENVKVVLKDKLTLSVEVRFQGRLKGDKNTLNTMFNDITAGPDKLVQFREVYAVYGKMAVQNKVREIVSQYSVDDVHKNYARLSGEISKVLTTNLANTPLEISSVAVGNIQYPDVVTKAIEAAEERRLAITKEEANREIELTKKENDRLIAEAEYQVRMTKAKTVRDENKMLAEGITPALLQLKQLEVQQTLAENAGDGTVYVPVEFGNSSGVSNRMFGKQ